MKIAFIYIAEPYQCYHTATVASALASIPNTQVVEYYSFPETPLHLRRIRHSLNLPDLPQKPFPKSWKTKALKHARRHDQERTLVLKENIEELNRYDAVIATEYSAGILKKMGLTKPKLILLMHGAAGRYVKDQYLVPEFDLVLLSGAKEEAFFESRGLLAHNSGRIIGYPKFDVFAAMRHDNTIHFENGHLFALYNPHCQRALTSASKWMMPLIQGFRAQINKPDGYNLVVAPHIKMFHKGFGFKERALKRQQGPGILVDTGSPAMLDMTYTSQAALYIGDVSSQIYEFLAIPRPCVFLNPRKIPWKNDPHFVYWTLGDVVDNIHDLMPTIANAAKRHALYRPAQEKFFQEAFGTSLLGASQRGAKAIMQYLTAS
ncbi:hypothetical protein GOB86_07515 [Acetobacter lambici]|uniref:Glycerophosphotransferase n=1 Tax=Acetobacter lambici TaxID=1332824 RepID=A0ABT1F4Q8_9PROT|nr:hypothetical protein [Acetobacter lambici]MCP1242431.1 hypothetical protein [Acetobacter lambici]MCP1258704.1 hypothetical protein [Acetobacter lambici]NHO56911.1 hypothetical protein [Acetobacter lambici]